VNDLLLHGDLMPLPFVP